MGKKSKKAKKDKLPKSIAGVKVPKELREAGGVLMKLARDPNAREVALAAVTAALAARKDNRKAARNAVAEGGEVVEKSLRWMGPALTAAAVEAGRLLIDVYEGGKQKRDRADEDGEDRQPAKSPIAKKEATPEITH